MIHHARGRPHYESLRKSRVVLTRMAPLVRFGLFAVGVSLFLDQAKPLLSDAQFTWGERRVMGIVALVTVGGFGLAGWVAGRLLGTAAEMIDVIVDGVEAAGRTADLIELHMVPALNRLAGVLERSQASPRDDERTRAAAGVRRMIQSRRWVQAERLVRAFDRDHAGSADAARLAEALDEARRAEVEGLRARLDAAQDADDLEGVVDARDALTEHLRGSELSDLDRRVVRWLMDRVQERLLRSGSVGPELAALAARVVDSFGDTDEARKLRAALPQLRRRAGLCPRCGQPYRGRAGACPQCLAAGAPIPAPDAPETEVAP
jgi:hypothetical protein